MSVGEVVPSVTVAGLGLGLLLPRITVAPTVASSRVTETLIGVGFGVLGLVSIIFSLLFLVVQWAFSSLSPRLNLFRDDPIVWRAFAYAIGLFVFCFTAAFAIGNDKTVSVIVQVISFKLTGKRVFRMAPIHHHYEQLGWREPTIVIRFWIVAVVLALIGLATLKLR